jgi:AcrR family transcriptional regulator
MPAMPRRSAAAVADSRADVLDVAVRRASIDGLEGLTIGRLADEVSMSKSGLHGMFGSKGELQAAAFARGVEDFTREVWSPVAGHDAGLPRLLALIDRWVAYHRRRRLPGGCLVTTATIEFDARPGPLRDAVAGARRRMHRAIAADVRIAVEAGDVPAGTDPDDAAFALYALASAASQAIQLAEPGAAARARRCMRAVLGVTA